MHLPSGPSGGNRIVLSFKFQLMRIIRLVIVSIIVFFIIITTISLFIPSHIQMAKAVQINAPKDSVMEQLSDPRNWRNWYPGGDSSKFFYKNDTIKGLILDETNQRDIIITDKKEDEVMAVYLLANKKIPTGWKILSVEDPNSVTVQWYIDFHLRWYPWEKFTSFMFEKVYDPQLQKGLNNLKAYVEKHQ